MTRPTQIALRPMLPDDGPILAAIFAASIDELTGDDYAPAQQAAWIGTADDEASFAKRLQAQLTILATVAGEVAGFASLKGQDELDMLYVQPDAVGQGVASALCDALEKIAKGRGAGGLRVAASDTAQGFFAKRGYLALHRETVPLGDEWLGRTAMRLTLAAPDTEH
ncbi:GNAT family N-acetyltransferase [Lichenihabitans sp. Uapishka_5]|uniref:GNAT family N-acetyltransferase n=1 Tax=Lichenihabitans sp. Uapishka_5 TaxID=3037302 RepID=UPI0029E7F740|nr:GNAT family N-acetyltransferase [Lichenihabitans sp. Uapishka_5]MDX7949864.1 GNAT family N-acetyltransferase [Lichenihabitans sp. Uapishka_5]